MTDLIERLKPYLRHKEDCNTEKHQAWMEVEQAMADTPEKDRDASYYEAVRGLQQKKSFCTCGYNKLISELQQSQPLPGVTQEQIVEDGCVCRRCKNKYKMDFLLPDELWAAINPLEYQILCGECIAEYMEHHLGFSAFRIIPVDSHVSQYIPTREQIACTTPEEFLMSKGLPKSTGYNATIQYTVPNLIALLKEYVSTLPVPTRLTDEEIEKEAKANVCSGSKINTLNYREGIIYGAKFARDHYENPKP